MPKSEEIVLYSDDKAIVLYNEGDGIHVTERPCDRDIPPAQFANQCPLCGNSLDASQYTYVAHAYFYLLQRNFKKWEGRNNDQQKSYEPRSASVGRRCDPAQSLPSSDDGLRGQGITGCSLRGASISRRATITEDGAFETSYINSERHIDTPKHIPPELLVTGYYSRFFEEKAKLGSGSFGHVYYCVHIIDGFTLGEYAVKKLPVGDDRIWLRKIMREVKIRERLRHRNIVDYNHSWLEMHRLNEFCPYVPWLFVLMGYCNGGDLEGFIKLFGDQLDDEEVFVLLLDIVNGLSHLHRHSIIYRDLKPSNILLHLNKKEGVSAMISDFGTSELMAELGENHIIRQGFTGTVEYTAPELLETDQYGVFSSFYDTQSDMWSLGIILYYLCYSRLPYFDECPKKCRDKILTHRFLKLPKEPERRTELKMLIVALTQRTPELRPDCESILSDRRMLTLINDEDFIGMGKAKIAIKLSQIHSDISTKHNISNLISR
ncbi:eukaryotic translation initiation factor 2-alpha kinase like protein [Babesia gibsoni]|uniref:Eukaryotic translation initiation factor 2-alpha kinase like protein n=1 Tax=Babesia gibsoni TaxID=33632 RepID=A0AAD8PGV7_BABGI|nr:eukaryotic translation initiation factor 2-alpha kinase like protein [Babesia gibsoni]